MGKTNYINIDKITYLGNGEYGIGADNKYIFTEDELKLNINYQKFREKLILFTRFLKISKLKNENVNKYIGKIIYNNPFFIYDIVGNPSFSNAMLKPALTAKHIEVKITIKKLVN